MKISARNTLSGTITAIELGSVNNEVTIELAPSPLWSLKHLVNV